MSVILLSLVLSITHSALLTAQTNPQPTKPLPWEKIDLPPFPKDNPSQAFSSFKIYDAQNNPIRIPREDWENARALIAKDPAWQTWLEKTRQSVDEWMVNHPENIQWVTGWYHDFVSPKDGSPLIWTSAVPGQTLSSHSDPIVEVTPKIFGGWVFSFRTRNAQKILEAARLYRLTGEKKYAEWAASQIDFYADNFAQWPVTKDHRKGCRIMWQSLDEAMNLIQYVNAARTLADFVPQQRREGWIEKLFKPDAILLQKSGQIFQNIPCWHRSAEAIVAMYCNDDALWKEAVDGPYGVRNQVKRGVTSDYLWYEQSIGYNYFVVSALTPVFRYALMTGRGDALRSEMKTVENLMLSPVMMRFPTGQCPNPADAPAPETVPNMAICAASADIFPTKIGVQRISTTKNWEDLLDPQNTPPAGSFVLPLVQSLNMESSRMAVLKSGSWQVYLHYGQLGPAHSQAEALNFEAFFNNTDITHDPGTVPYGSPLSKNYYRRGVCHNVPLVDGLDQEGWDPGKLISWSSNSITATQPKYRSNAQVSRTITIEGERLSDSVTLTTLDKQIHALGFVLNLEGKVLLPASFTSDHVFNGVPPQNGFQYWTNVRSSKFTNEATFDVDYKNLLIHITFDLPGEFTITSGSAPGYPPKRRDSLYLETRGQTATLKTRFLPTSSENAVDIRAASSVK